MWVRHAISWIFSLTNWRDHSRLVIWAVCASPFGPGGRSTVLRVLMDGEVSTRNMVTVY